MAKLYSCPRCKRSTAMSYCPFCRTVTPTASSTETEPESAVTTLQTPQAKKRGPREAGKLPHGGARPGSGRKTKPVEEHHMGVEFSLPPMVLKLLDDLARQEAARQGVPVTRSSMAAEAIRELARKRGLLGGL